MSGLLDNRMTDWMTRDQLTTDWKLTSRHLTIIQTSLDPTK
jgi:hypothetical protein